MTTHPRIHIVGLGSPHGDDLAGWAVIDLLAGEPLPAGVGLHRCMTPARDLLGALDGATRVVLVDAIDGLSAGAVPGTLLQCAPAGLRNGTGPLSSHGVSVKSLLDLAGAARLLPDDLHCVGVAIDPAQAVAGRTALSPPVARAVPELARVALDIALAPQLEPESESTA
jgi:hydrogenase maturation protease